ncbi:MAG: cupin domain-containing protein [Actinomycetota bacterium]
MSSDESTSRVRRGNLWDTPAPREGEDVDRVVQHRGVTIEQIVSGVVDVPLDFDQHFDEWVTVVEGAAVLRVGGEDTSMAPGRWLFLPRNTPHRLVSVDPGTRWLAVMIE